MKNNKYNSIKIFLILLIFFLFLCFFVNSFNKKNINNKVIQKDNVLNNRKIDLKVNNNQDKYNSLKIDDKDKNKILYKMIDKANSVCFIGDSISKGSKNGGYGWFLPLINAFDNKKVINISKGGSTVKSITDIYNREECDLYIIEIGTNDVRYRNKMTCSMNEREYIKNIKKLINKVPDNSNREFVFIAPWLSLDNDPWMMDVKKKNKLLNKYRNALKKYCIKNNYLYIDPNKKIEETFERDSSSKYLVDHIHPNSKEGIYLYSRAVLDSSK